MAINPLVSIDGKELPVLAKDGYGYSTNDMSGERAGRTEDLEMDKNLLGTAVKLTLKWENLTIAEASTVFKAFDPEYITVKYLDGREGKIIEKEFYSGNEKPAGNFNGKTSKWGTISVNIIERKAVKYA